MRFSAWFFDVDIGREAWGEVPGTGGGGGEGEDSD